MEVLITRATRSLPPWWLVGTVAGIFLLQVAVTLARPVSTYRLLALGADGTTLGLTAACFAVPPILLAVGLGRWTERHHPAILLASGLCVSAVAAFALVVSESIPAMAIATTALGIGHTCGAIGTQSIMAQARSSLARITRFGTLTAVSALGQIVGPVLGGLIIGHSEQPSLESTSSALLVAAWVFVGALPAAALAMRARIHASTVRTGRAERVWRLLRRRGMPAALMTSFSAKSGMDLLLVYMPLLGAVVGLTSAQVGVLLGISSTGALLARGATPFFVRRIPTLKLTVVATVVAATCLLVLAVSGTLAPMMIAMSVLGFALGLSQTTTMDWVVDLVDDTSRGSALGLRVATNRVGQAFILAVAGAVSGLWGVDAAFALLALVMFATAGAGVVSGRGGRQSA
ncbi:MAG TPA: MFS transporter [Mycobacterium sp.]|nr:MFS transporter [Mycobacterium sp.]